MPVRRGGSIEYVYVRIYFSIHHMPIAAKATPHRAGHRGRIVCYPGFLVLATCCALTIENAVVRLFSDIFVFFLIFSLNSHSYATLFANIGEKCKDESMRNSLLARPGVYFLPVGSPFRDPV